MKYSVKDYPAVQNRVNGMDVDELIKCVICPNTVMHSAEESEYENLLPPDVPVQMVVKPNVEKANSIKNFIASQHNVKRLICGDLECGAGKYIQGMTAFPSIMALGIINDEDLAYEVGCLAAQEGMEMGFNWSFAPCVDIVLNHDNPIVSTRGISDSVETVIKIGGAYMRGMQDNGLIATLKHFPGDGMCKYDQHLTSPENPMSMDEWYASYGEVYKQLIAQGAKSIMPGHISLPAYDDLDENMGMYPPATLSRKLMTDLLRGELGFEGIIVSDAINMSGFCGYMNFYDACCTFLEAGGDCLLFAHGTEEFLKEMRNRIDSGLLRMETLRNRAYRMLCFAEEYHETKKMPEERCIAKAQQCAKQVTERAIRIVRDRKNLIPCRIEKDTKILHAIIQNNYVMDDVQRLTAELSKFSAVVDEVTDPGPNFMKKVVLEANYDLIICTVGCQPAFGLNSVRLHGKVAKNMMNGWTKFGTPVIFINYGHPYLEEEYKAVMDTVINTYGTTAYTAEVLINLLRKTEGENE